MAEGGGVLRCHNLFALFSRESMAWSPLACPLLPTTGTSTYAHATVTSRRDTSGRSPDSSGTVLPGEDPDDAAMSPPRSRRAATPCVHRRPGVGPECDCDGGQTVARRRATRLLRERVRAPQRGSGREPLLRP